MVHRLVNVPHVPRNDEAPASLSLEQVLETLSSILLHMPTESQMTFLAMSRSNAPNLPSYEAPIIRTRPLRLPLAPDDLRGVIQAKTYVCFLTSASI